MQSIRINLLILCKIVFLVFIKKEGFFDNNKPYYKTKSMRTCYQLILIFTCFFIVSCSGLTPEELTCEYLQNPSVVDVPNPRLAWINIAPKGIRGQKQTAYQIRVASSVDKLQNPDLWDSQKVMSEQSTRVAYAGSELKSEQECWWQVRVWDKNGKASLWSKPAHWEMGLLNPSDWKAQWIGAPWQGEEALPKPTGGISARLQNLPPPAPLFRKEFSADKKIASAVAYVTGLGYFELYVNGEKVSNNVLVPNQTNYGKRPGLKDAYISVEDNFREYRVMYLAYDIKNMLHQGKNVVGSILGNGFYNPAKGWDEAYGSPRFMGQIHIKYTDGTDELIVSDTSWKASKSPILMDMVYYGEIYDARQEQDGWCSPGFDDSTWGNAIERKTPAGKLVAQTSLPDRVTKRISPIKIEKTGDGKYKVDFGEEISGWVRLVNVKGPAGQKIHISFNSNEYSGENTYILRGKGAESYSPRFNWFVFSGIEIDGWPGELKPENLVAEAVNTNIEETATFETSNPLFNTINKIWKRSEMDNMHGGVASDCPHRERSAYTGDGQVSCVTVMHNFDARAFYQKWISDIRGAQNVETGYVPNGAPWQPGCGGGVGWGAAICIMPWEFYLHYGSPDMLKDNYEAMKGYVSYMQKWVDDDGIMYSQVPGHDGKPLKWFNLGDWVAPGPLPPDNMVHTFFFWRCADLTAKTARALDKPEEAKKYAALAEATRQAFYKGFYDKKNGTYGKTGGNIFALKMGIPADQYPRVVAALKSDIKANNGHLDTGIFGTQFFFEVLAENGMQDLACEAMNKKDEPGYGHWIEEGSTTTREQWNDENSHNHPMFGGGLTWFYRKLAGMNADPENPGYRHIIFRPQPAGDLTFVNYSNKTSYGEAGIKWTKMDENFTMEITVPVGSYGSVYVPAKRADDITESEKPATGAEGVQFEKMQDGYAVFKVESGKYKFIVRL